MGFVQVVNREGCAIHLRDQIHATWCKRQKVTL